MRRIKISSEKLAYRVPGTETRSDGGAVETLIRRSSRRETVLLFEGYGRAGEAARKVPL